MKHILILFIIGCFALSCKAQTLIVDLDTYIGDKPQGSYSKDVNNELNKFVGTWEYTNGNTLLKIILYKTQMNYDGEEFYFDDLRGEYSYIESGIEIVNTLPNLINDPENHGDRNILVQSILSNNDMPPCDDCSSEERRVSLGFYDPERDYLNYTITLRYLVGQTNPEKMEVTIFESDSAILPYEGAPETIRVPSGTYLMEKQ